MSESYQTQNAKDYVDMNREILIREECADFYEGSYKHMLADLRERQGKSWNQTRQKQEDFATGIEILERIIAEEFTKTN